MRDLTPLYSAVVQALSQVLASDDEATQPPLERGLPANRPDQAKNKSPELTRSRASLAPTSYMPAISFYPWQTPLPALR
jgi:hypothetical protein